MFTPRTSTEPWAAPHRPSPSSPSRSRAQDKPPSALAGGAGMRYECARMRPGQRLRVWAERTLAVSAALSCWVALVNREILPHADWQALKAVVGILGACLLFVVPVWRAF